VEPYRANRIAAQSRESTDVLGVDIVERGRDPHAFARAREDLRGGFANVDLSGVTMKIHYDIGQPFAGGLATRDPDPVHDILRGSGLWTVPGDVHEHPASTKDICECVGVEQQRWSLQSERHEVSPLKNLN